jgi:integrase
MPRSANTLTPTHEGGFVARKTIPADVVKEYAKLYGKRTEERLNTGPMKARLAWAKYREWLSDVEARIHNIRAARKGEGSTLTPLQARALAGEWYGWFVALAGNNKWPAHVWEDYEAHVRDQLHGPAMGAINHVLPYNSSADITTGTDRVFSGDPLDFWERDAGMRERVRPLIADEAKPHQFLAAKGKLLDDASKAMFLDYVTRDFFAAVRLLARRARGDHGPDEWAKQFPQTSEGASDTALTAWVLFERWIASAKPADSTVDRWRTVFRRLQADFPDTPAAALLPEQMQAWANGLIKAGKPVRKADRRDAGTVANIYVRAARTVFNWAVEENLISRNPFTGWRVKVPKKIRTRETKRFTTEEISMILNAAVAMKVGSKGDGAKRWCPWLAAYSGARMGELTQLRAVDIIKQDGIHAMKISPEAGTTKTGSARTVPIHEHLIEQGFLEFVKASGKGPLFYNASKDTAPDQVPDPTNPRKPRSVKGREHLAAWVRKLGVNDPELSPNHAWRHTFKGMADRCGISEKMTDTIVGHAPATVGRGYGEALLTEKAEALRKFPRYKVDE